MAEGQAWFLRRYDSRRALRFLTLFDLMKPLEVVDIMAGDRQGAVATLHRFSDQSLTFCDALGLHLMGQRRTTPCWSTDFHLGLTGVPLAIHQ